MKVAIVGYGAMGHEIEQVLKARGHEISAIVDPNEKDATFKEISAESMKGVDVAIDFTNPKTAFDNIKKYCATKTNVVVATTGWYDHLAEAEKMAKDCGIGLIWSGNFSIGVNLFFRIVRDACRTVGKIKDYDAYSYEWHHKRKKDSPSGTAEMLGKIMLENLPGKDTLVREKLDRAIAPNEIHLASIRGGYMPGQHVVGFDSPADTIELKHTARSRQGFALGAVMAAEWVKGKKGFFGIDDFLEGLLGKESP